MTKDDQTNAFGAGRGPARAAQTEPPLVWCEACHAEVQIITVFEAAAQLGVSSRTIYEWAEDGKLHSTRTQRGVLLICLSPLLHLIEEATDGLSEE